MLFPFVTAWDDHIQGGEKKLCLALAYMPLEFLMLSWMVNGTLPFVGVVVGLPFFIQLLNAADDSRLPILCLLENSNGYIRVNK